MRKGEIIKSTLCDDYTDENLTLINNYSRRKLAKEDVYIFSLVLCDNEIDRDFEAFDTKALYMLANLFVGKTGILDHNPKAENQTARIFKCSVEKTGETTSFGVPYYRLTAMAYMPCSEKNKEFINAIDSGIVKEVSVGCSVEQTLCSICGEEKYSTKCSHIQGKKYGNTICYNILHNPKDAYEWSFVAVPSQKKAGVIKQFTNTKEETMEDILKALNSTNEVTFTPNQLQRLKAHIEKAEQNAVYGKRYHSDLQNDVLRLSMIVQPNISKAVMNDVTAKMTIEQLKEFKKGYEIMADKTLPPVPQLFNDKDDNSSFGTNNEFNI